MFRLIPYDASFIVFFVGVIPPWLPVIYRHQAAYITHPGWQAYIYLIHPIGKGYRLIPSDSGYGSERWWVNGWNLAQAGGTGHRQADLQRDADVETQLLYLMGQGLGL